MVFYQTGLSFVQDSDETLFAPLITPWVLYDPSAIFLISHQQNWMINLSVMTIVVNSWIIILPSVRINRNWQRTQSCQILLYNLSVIWKHRPRFLMFENFLGCWDRLAFILNSSIRILFLKHNTGVFYILHCPLWPWSTTSLTSIFCICATFNQLLLRIVVQSLVFHGNCSLKCACCRKSPAWSAWPLIFYWSYDSFISPVHWSRCHLNFLWTWCYFNVFFHIFEIWR